MFLMIYFWSDINNKKAKKFFCIKLLIREGIELAKKHYFLDQRVHNSWSLEGEYGANSWLQEREYGANSWSQEREYGTQDVEVAGEQSETKCPHLLHLAHCILYVWCTAVFYLNLYRRTLS